LHQQGKPVAGSPVARTKRLNLFYAGLREWGHIIGP
jgi:hypothetical protein